MKLFLAEFIRRDANWAKVIVADDPEDAMDKAWGIDDSCYGIDITEIPQIDGYKVILEKIE